MSTVQVVSEVNIDLNQLLEGVAQLDLGELEQFAFNVNALVARRKAPSLPKREADLPQQINQGIPLTARQRYTLLNQKMLNKTLTPEENQELGVLIDQIEQSDVERLTRLIELAQLRGVALDTLMGQLGIRRTPDV
jgi:hypothetical protein